VLPKTYTEAEVQALIGAAIKEVAATISRFEEAARERGELSREGAFCLCVDEILSACPDHKAALDAYVAGKVREALEGLPEILDRAESDACQVEGNWEGEREAETMAHLRQIEKLRALIPEAQS
jgi:hypothetical protein